MIFTTGYHYCDLPWTATRGFHNPKCGWEQSVFQGKIYTMLIYVIFITHFNWGKWFVLSPIKAKLSKHGWDKGKTKFFASNRFAQPVSWSTMTARLPIESK